MAKPDDWSLRVEHLGKDYELGERGGRARSLYELLGSWRERAGRRPGGGRERFWALQDVSFAVARGEVVGIVGRNGAGKSTLLKILSRITAPSAGRVLLRGTVASLLEVGTGFHPELTGRENVYLNGTILGMRRKEIDRKFDEIVEFAEIERFLDTPVKRYSSGMYVRLAFSVAAHLDADILLVDEVLAVGDAAFQRKSLGKMEEVAGGGRTVLFVSHNLGAVRSLCGSVVLLENGQVTFRGPTEKGLERYESSWSSAAMSLDRAAFRGSLKEGIEFTEIEVRQGGRATTLVDPTQPFEVSVAGRAERSFGALALNLGFSREGVRLFSCHDAPSGTPLPAGSFRSRFEIPGHVLRPGRWAIGLGAYQPGGDWTWGPEVALIELSEKWDGSMQARDTGWVTVPVVAERTR